MTGRAYRFFTSGRPLASILTYLVGLATATSALAQAPALFISEYTAINVPPNFGNNRYVELVNLTGAPVSLVDDEYRIHVYFNGSTSPGTNFVLNAIFDINTGDEIPIANGDVYVISRGGGGDGALPEPPDMVVSASNFNFEGNDAIVLLKNGVIIDSLGKVGQNPGIEWGTGLTSTSTATLRRKATVCGGDVNTNDNFDPAVQWIGIEPTNFLGYGMHHGCLDGSDNMPPVAGNDILITNEDTRASVYYFANDTDVDGAIDPTSVILVSAPLNGGATLNAATGVITYPPDVHFSGTDTFTYTVRDNYGLISNVATIRVTVGPPDRPRRIRN